MNRPVDVFHIGPQKSGTTWVYECLKEHPAVALPPIDSIHYFDIHYTKGRDWYEQHFEGSSPDQIRIDPTPSYLRSPYAAARVAQENPEAKIIVCLRHPIERAFSHYWHEKRQRRFDYEFSEILEIYDLWSNLLESGFYSRLLERWFAEFDSSQILIQLFDDLKESPRAFLDEILAFIGLESGFEPSVLDRKVNQAKAPDPAVKTGTKRLLNQVGLLDAAKKAKGALRQAGLVDDVSTKGVERLEDVDPEVMAQLAKECDIEIDRLQKLTGIDLSSWRST